MGHINHSPQSAACAETIRCANKGLDTEFVRRHETRVGKCRWTATPGGQEARLAVCWRP